MSHQRVFGVTGWKKSGKTTLVTQLVSEFRRRGWTVATVKHAHHSVDVDRPETDSWKHRAAGATEVALVGGLRYAIMREQAEATLEEVLARLAPADLILIEGYKRERHPKIEVRTDHSRPIAGTDSNVVAIAADQPAPETHLPRFARDDIAGIADFISQRLK